MHLINAKDVLFVEPGRMSSVANNKARSIEMHATFIAANEQVRALTHRSCAMHVRSSQSCRSVAWTRMNLKTIIGTRNAVGEKRDLVFKFRGVLSSK